MKFIVKAAGALVKGYILISVFNQLSYLEYKVKSLETEVNKLKGAAEG